MSIPAGCNMVASHKGDRKVPAMAGIKPTMKPAVGRRLKNMANTYTQIFLHIVFAVKDRESLLRPDIQEELYTYLAGACKNRTHHPIAINGTADHVHMLIGFCPTESLASFVQSIKIESSKWLKREKGIRNFAWQTGYAAFSYSKSLLPQVETYIAHQKEHHSRNGFDEEMKSIMERSGIAYEEAYRLHGIDISPT